MAGRRTLVLDVREMVRRLRLGEAGREIARDLGCNRRTIAKYHRLAQTEGWLSRPELPAPGEIDLRLTQMAPTLEWGPESSVEPHRDTVVALRAKGVEVTALWQILRDQHGYAGAYASVLRFVHRLEPKTPEAFVRIETKPGEEAQVDFGYAGRFLDRRCGRLRKAWVFVMTLSWSRHQYAEIVFDQSVETWLALHVRAFESFGGVPAKIVIDNLKAAITKACFEDPQVQRSYRELAEHYDFLISPCRPRTPEHKGKVENGVHYVKRNALAGREFADIDAANAHLARWVREVAGVRDHGTTHERPLDRFEIERPAFRPLPATPYVLAVWKEVKLHPDPRGLRPLLLQRPASPHRAASHAEGDPGDDRDLLRSRARGEPLPSPGGRDAGDEHPALPAVQALRVHGHPGPAPRGGRGDRLGRGDGGPAPARREAGGPLAPGPGTRRLREEVRPGASGRRLPARPPLR
ncbi:MAG: IS21 family transposase [Planctomycetes bacterium]|nr:IS21 family transposase [Planctomycetota bacterium]